MASANSRIFAAPTGYASPNGNARPTNAASMAIRAVTDPD